MCKLSTHFQTGPRRGCSLQPRQMPAGPRRAAQQFIQAEAASRLGLLQALGAMSKRSSIDKGTQWFSVIAGIMLLWLGLSDALTSYSLGFFQFTINRSVFTGHVAGVLIGAHIFIGVLLVGSSLRKLENR